jgi:hypothetical protein
VRGDQVLESAAVSPASGFENLPVTARIEVVVDVGRLTGASPTPGFVSAGRTFGSPRASRPGASARPSNT